VNLSDWTERYRPETERQLEGNESNRKIIRNWLDQWQHGRPKKPGLLLVGPPGVGKTTIARAVANDMGWDVIELNASDARNAVAIRKAATNASTHRSLFMDHDSNKRTLILLDEVDHLTGGLHALSEERLKKNLSQDENAKSVSGDSGGKAELLRLLNETKQPVFLACNEEMGLWGRGSSWRSTRDRFMRHLIAIRFTRVTKDGLRKIAKRILTSENYTVDADALDELVERNPGDLRALVRDLQVISTLADNHISKSDVLAHYQLGQRDTSLEVFSGLQELYMARTAEKASNIARTLDKSPDDLLAWVSWNNAAVMTDNSSIKRASKALTIADTLLASRFTNTAQRSWYWGSQLASLAASVTSNAGQEGRIYCSYPDFLRYSGASVRSSIIERLADTCGCSRSAVIEEILPPLLAVQNGDGDDFSISLALGLSPEEHASLSGLNTTHRSTKELMERYLLEINKPIESPVEELDQTTPPVDEQSIADSGQKTLF
jgi:replication factor C large subunit